MFEPNRWNARGARTLARLQQRIARLLLRPGEISAPAHPTGLAAELADSELVRIPLDRLRIEHLVRICGPNPRHVDALAEVAAALPPIVVHRPSMTVIDGAHRVRAAQSAGAQWIDAVYFDGDDAQAFLLAVRLNSVHGLPLSAADRKAAAEQALCFFPEWSNRALSEAIGLSERAIAGIRKRAAAKPPRLRPGRHHPPIPTHPPEARRASRFRTEGSATRRITPGHHDCPPALRALRSDPALCRSAAGRQLLGTLESLPWDPAAWSQLADGLSPHSAALIADLASRQADQWAALAEVARRRADAIAETSAA